MSASTPSQRASVVALARHADPYPFLQAGLPLLEQEPHDAELRLLVISQLARLGLALPAYELAEAVPELVAQHAPLQQALQTLQAQAQPPLPWQRMRPVFANNYPTAVEHHDTIRTNAPALQAALDRLDLFRATDGNFHASRRIGNGPRRWLPTLVDWRNLAAGADVLPKQNLTLCPPYFIEGIGFGELLERVWQGTRNAYLDHSPQIHVCEQNLAQLALWLHTGDRRQLLRDPRVHIWCGPHALDAFTAHLALAKNALTPKAVIRQPGWGPSKSAQARPVVERINQARMDLAQQQHDRIQQRCATRDAHAYYAERFAQRNQQPLRVLGITSRHTTYLQYSMRDIGDALNKLGHNFQLLIEPDTFTAHVPREQILSHVAQLDPDLIILIDHNSWEYGDLYNYDVPFCNWIQDDLPHLFTPGVGRNARPFDLICGLIGETRARANNYPIAQCKYLPMPVSTEMFADSKITDAERDRYGCDLSFVSNLSIAPDRYLADTRAALTDDPQARKLISALYETLGPRIAAGRVPSSPAETTLLIQSLASQLNFEWNFDRADAFRQCYGERLLNIFFRQQPLLWAVDMGLEPRLYGRGWKHHPQLGKFAQGVAHNGRQLRCIYQSTRLNLQLFPNAIVHQRLLEGLSSGGFFLIRGTPYDHAADAFAAAARRAVALGISTNAALHACDDPELTAAIDTLQTYDCVPLEATTFHDYVKIGNRLDMVRSLPRYRDVVFRTKEDFARAVARYLTDPLARDEIAAEQRTYVRNNFSYELLVEELLEFTARYFASRAAAAPNAAATGRTKP